jgi:hypothetical protein
VYVEVSTLVLGLTTFVLLGRVVSGSFASTSLLLRSG